MPDSTPTVPENMSFSQDMFPSTGELEALAAAEASFAPPAPASRTTASVPSSNGGVATESPASTPIDEDL